MLLLRQTARASVRRPSPLLALRQSYSAAAKPTPASTPAAAATTTSSTTSTTESARETKDNKLTATEEVKEEEKPKETYDEQQKRLKREEKGYAFGANHWNLERASAVGLIPLLSTQFVYGPQPIVDGLLGVVLPYHIYMGFDSCITDYIPKRVYPRGYKAAMWTLRLSFALTMWGCYEFNTNDIGITEAVQRIWTA
ncbi:CybS-domain-containing protein [Gongronella butleri]|nr:CybS-domain-containing protein [Gongronella butleri]